MASTLISSVLSISNDNNTKPVFGTGNFNPVTSRSYVGEATSDDRPQRALSYESGCETLAAYPIINGFLLDGFTGDAHTLTELESLDMELIALGDGNLTETLACTGEADNETFTSPTDHGLAVGDYVHITAITGGTSLQVFLEGAPDNGSGAPGSYADWWTSPVYAEATLVAGARLYDMDFPRPPAGIGIPRFLRLGYESVGTHTAGSLGAWIVLDRIDQPYQGTGNAVLGGYPAGITVAN